MTNKVTALVLAGSRRGGDPLARAFEVPHKAALPVAGRPMGEWVVDALRKSPRIGRIMMAADWRSLGPAVPLLTTQEKIVPVAAMPTIGETVDAVLDAVPPPVLITTVDHPLLTPAMIDEFLDRVPPGADAAVAVARAETVLSAYPEARRTFVRFRRARVTGCNLFLLATPRARSAVRFWSGLDSYRKDPGAMVAALGMGSVLLWWLGLLTLDGAAQRLSRRVGANLAVVEMSSPEAAIDVDKPEDLRLADAILVRRGAYWANG
ncbi:MAG TPA: NTP transferase domain-containing protein [Candidatus Omnitrophota bacterium]|nr:NTP transferase domain-containing protein [Candidatus Omnitrophota bacterium]